MECTFVTCFVLLVPVLNLGSRVKAAASETSFIVHSSGSTRKGETLTLNCFLDGPSMASVNSPTSYIWFKNGEPIPGETGISLVLKGLTSQDEGNYLCGSPDVDIPRKEYHLDLFPSLPMPEIVQPGVAVSGRKSSLTCVVQDDDPVNGEVKYAWYKDSKMIEDQSGPVLLFDNVTEKDKGIYSCTARTESLPLPSHESPVFRLIPLVAPEVSIKPATRDSKVKGTLDGNLTLTCEARGFPEVPANGYSWYHQPSYQLPQRPLGQNSSILILDLLTKSDSGIYTCQARNDQNVPGVTLSGHAAVTVDVVYLQNISMSPDQTVQEGNPVSLKCSVDSHPKAYITWEKNGLYIRRAISNNNYYNISQASCSDTGAYTCQAVNPEMPEVEISATAQVHVQCTAELPIEGPRFDVIQPDAAPFDFPLPNEMSLVVVHPSGQDMVIVHPNCSFLFSSAFLPRCRHSYCDPERYRLYFALINVTESDEGMYSCVEVEKQRKQIPNCGKKLVSTTGQVTDGTWQEKQIFLVYGATVTIIAVVFGVLLVFTNRHEILRWIKILWEDWTAGCCRSESVDVSRTFASLYDIGKVYVIPELIPPKQQPTLDDGENETEATHFLRQNSCEEDAYSDFAILDRVRFTLQQLTSEKDLPSFLLHNTNIGKSEKIILILHRKLGVVLMSVKTIAKENCGNLIKEAANCLIETKKAVRKALQGLVKPEGITAILALPIASKIDEANVKQHLESTTEVEMLFGKNKDDFQQWAEHLKERSDSQVWDFSIAGVNNPDIAFKVATSKFLTLSGGSQPGESLHLPLAIQLTLLTPAQMEVRDSPAKFLHMWGPPGEGKTALLIHRALRWLADGKAVVVVVARDIIAAMIKHYQEHPKLRICYTPTEMKTALEELKAAFPDVEICVFTGIPHRPGMLQTLLNAVKSKQASAALTMFPEKLQILDPDLSVKYQNLGWKSVHLPQQIQDTEETESVFNVLMKGKERWNVVDHCLHKNSNSNTSCNQCKEELASALPSSHRDPPWKDWIAFHTGNQHVFTELQPLCETLQGLEVPAVLANKHDGEIIPPLPPDGEDNKQSNVSLLWVFDKLGVKMTGVLVVHQDDRDNQPDCPSGDRDLRLVEHTEQWKHAVSCSSGQVVFLLLTPSPAQSLLNLSDPYDRTQQRT